MSGTNVLLLYICTWCALLKLPQQCHSEAGSCQKVLHTSCNTDIQSGSCVTHILSMTADHRHLYGHKSKEQTKWKLLVPTPELLLPSL